MICLGAEEVQTRDILQLQRDFEQQCQMCQAQRSECRMTFSSIMDRLAKGAEHMAVHDEQIKTLQTWETTQNGSLNTLATSIMELSKSMATSISTLTTEINNLRLEVVGGRPTWATTIILSILCSLVVGLSVALLRGG